MIKSVIWLTLATINDTWHKKMVLCLFNAGKQISIGDFESIYRYMFVGVDYIYMVTV